MLEAVVFAVTVGVGLGALLLGIEMGERAERRRHLELQSSFAKMRSKAYARTARRAWWRSSWSSWSAGRP